MHPNESIKTRSVASAYSDGHGMGWDGYRKEEKRLCTQFGIGHRFSFPHSSLLSCKLLHSLLDTCEQLEDK